MAIAGFITRVFNSEIQIIIGFFIGNAVSAYLLAGPLGRSLARTIQFIRLEKKIGFKFQHADINQIRNHR